MKSAFIHEEGWEGLKPAIKPNPNLQFHNRQEAKPEKQSLERRGGPNLTVTLVQSCCLSETISQTLSYDMQICILMCST